jgi:hypothetical protein
MRASGAKGVAIAKIRFVKKTVGGLTNSCHVRRPSPPMPEKREEHMLG